METDWRHSLFGHVSGAAFGQNEDRIGTIMHKPLKHSTQDSAGERAPTDLIGRFLKAPLDLSSVRVATKDERDDE